MTRNTDSTTADSKHETVLTANFQTDSDPSSHSRVRKRFSNCVARLKSHRSDFLIGLTSSVITLTLPAPVAAQSQVGSGICGTPLAETINQAAPLVVGTLMIGAAILSYILHTAAAFPKDPQTVQTLKNWRNRAGMSAITTPLFAVVIEMFIGFTGTSVAQCVSIVPFF